MRSLLVRWLVLTLAIFLTTKLGFLGITCDSWSTLLVTALVLGILNAILRPILLLLSLPFVVLTLGLFVLVINALLFYWVGHGLVEGFHVPSFWSALGGSLVVSVVNLFFGVSRTKAKVEVKTQGYGGARPAPPPGKGPVIDI